MKLATHNQALLTKPPTVTTKTPFSYINGAKPLKHIKIARVKVLRTQSLGHNQPIKLAFVPENTRECLSIAINFNCYLFTDGEKIWTTIRLKLLNCCFCWRLFFSSPGDIPFIQCGAGFWFNKSSSKIKWNLLSKSYEFFCIHLSSSSFVNIIHTVRRPRAFLVNFDSAPRVLHFSHRFIRHTGANKWNSFL